MFLKRRWARQDNPPPRDERLSAVLREWKGVDPRAGFEAAVWRRIGAGVTEARGFSLIRIIRDRILPQPAWATALAATAAILIGVWAGLSLPAMRDSRQTVEPLLQTNTLAGSYLAMVAGESR